MKPELEELANPEGTLHIMASLRRDAEHYSAKEGVSLDQFVNIAVAEKLAYLQHEDWLRRRQPMTEARRLRALKLLDKAGSEQPSPEDQIPEGYMRS